MMLKAGLAFRTFSSALKPDWSALEQRIWMFCQSHTLVFFFRQFVHADETICLLRVGVAELSWLGGGPAGKSWGN